MSVKQKTMTLKENLEEKIEALGDVGSLQKTVVQHIQLNTSRLNNFSRSMDTVEDDIERLGKRLDKLEEENENLRSQLVEALEPETELGLSDAERIILKDWDAVSVAPTENRERAMRVVRNWDSWENKRGRGYDVLLFSTLREKLETELDEEIPYQTVMRIAEHVEKLTDGKIAVEEDKGEERMLYESEELVRSAEEL